MYFVYDSLLACVRDKCNYTEYFDCPRGVKQGCLLRPQMFAFFINELAIEMSHKKRKAWNPACAWSCRNIFAAIC